MRNLIIGTAGHVDHGKTEIVRALTGRDTDRLREEKERGISIVLGFAPLDLGDDITAGVVDVPGHERFVKNMVSGAVGVDLAILVVAADEGVMPQTEEHLEVLKLLGVDAGVIAITKMDLVERELAEIVKSEIEDLVTGTALENSPVVFTSVVTGEGLDDLKHELADQARKIRARGKDDFFRMPIDRIFTRSGIGTIVTGTTWGGEVKKGDELALEPTGKRVRVREVQSFDKALERGGAGMRAALALHGVRIDEIAIGHQILTPDVLVPSSMLDASIVVSALSGSQLKNRQRIRFHHAAGELIARVIILDREKLEVGDSGYIQLRLEKPTVARRGDRFVLRTYSPMRVVAGGKILDPVAAKAKRLKDETLEFLKTLDEGSDGEVIQSLASKRGTLGVSREEFRRFGMIGAEAGAIANGLEEKGKVFSVGNRIVDAAVVSAKEKEFVDVVEGFVSKNRLLWGMDRGELKEKVGLGEGPLFDFLLERGKQEGRFFFRGGKVRVGSGERDLSEHDRKALETLEGTIERGGYEFPNKTELRAAVGDEKHLTSFLHILEEDGRIVRISSETFIHRKHWNELVKGIKSRLVGGGVLSVGDFKEIFGFSRKYAVPLLEYLDREGFTRREGDVRVAGPKLADLAGKN